MNEDDIAAYVASKNIVPGTLLWTTEKPLDEDAFRAGAKNHASVDFLRWSDIAKHLVMGQGRIPVEQWGNFVILPDMGISLFIKKMIPQGMQYVGSMADHSKSEVKKDFDPYIERFWWKIEKGQILPAGLQLVYDGVPPGHCILAPVREMSVADFMALVKKVAFGFAGADYYGVKR